MKSITKLVERVMSEICLEHSKNAQAIKEQFSCAKIVDIHITGAGIFADFEVERNDLPRINQSIEFIDSVYCIFADTKGPCTVHLHVSNGLIDSLEIAAGEDLPVYVSDFQVVLWENASIEDSSLIQRPPNPI